MPKRALPFVAAVALVIAISVLAYNGGVPSFVARLGLDKVLHAAMGFALTALLARALRGRAVVAGVIVMLPLATDEYLQRFSESRSSDWADLAADIIGVTLAILVVRGRAAIASVDQTRVA